MTVSLDGNDENDILEHGIYNSDQMSQIDALCQPYISTKELMENAGWSVARNICKYYAPQKTLVLCGPGNNGGDGYVTARYLRQAGWPIKIAYLKAPKDGSLSEHMSRLFHGPYVSFTASEVKKASLVVDGLFGAGLSRDIGPQIASVLKEAKHVVAIDVPTGVDGNFGKIRGYAPHAELTVTFCRLKPAHLLYPAKEYVGHVVLTDIGTPQEVLKKKRPNIWHNHPSLWHLPEMTPQSNKYRRGVVTICAGHTMPGAALLASSSARVSGAGLVTLVKPKGSVFSGYALPPGLIVTEESIDKLLADHRKKTWVCGPGLTEDEVKIYMPALIANARNVVADAGVFSAYKGQPQKLRGVSVITPHEGEFRRLFDFHGDITLQDVCNAAKLMQAVCVLKGASTIIGAPDGRLCINTHATPALATAGSGDTLSGIVAALIANGMSPWQAACAAVWIHGEAGKCAGNWPIAEDLDKYIGVARAKATMLEQPNPTKNENSAFSCPS